LAAYSPPGTGRLIHSYPTGAAGEGKTVRAGGERTGEYIRGDRLAGGGGGGCGDRRRRLVGGRFGGRDVTLWRE